MEPIDDQLEEGPKEVVEALEDLILDFPRQNICMSDEKLEEFAEIIFGH